MTLSQSMSITAEKIEEIIREWVWTRRHDGKSELIGADQAAKRIALLQQGEPEGWKPIETAPKDGTKIITFAPDGGIEVSFYYADTLENGTAYETWRDDGCEPTHWMPLPPAPGAETGERKPGEVLQEALLDLVRLCTRNNIGDLDLKLGGVVADGKDVGDWHLTLKSLATTPPAEGETK